MSADLKSIVDRINRVMDERDELTADIRDIYAEAKGRGYIPKALRKVVARLRTDPEKLAEDDALLETYEAALGRVGKAMRAVREGATLDEAAEANGVHRATLARARAVAKQSENATASDVVGGGGGPVDHGTVDEMQAAKVSLEMPPIPDFLRRVRV